MSLCYMKILNSFIKVLIVPFICFAILTSCNSGGGGNGDGIDNTIIVELRGFYAGEVQTNGLSQNNFEDGNTQSIKAIDADELSMILAFSKSGNYQSATVVDGYFSISVNIGEPVGLIFVDKSNGFLGYMTLGDGLDTIPLTTIKKGVATIDFSALSKHENIIEPEYNPIGNEIILSHDELNYLQQFDDHFAAIIQYPDVDRNGVIDLLEGKYYDITFDFNLEGGYFGEDYTPILFDPVKFKHYQLNTNLCEYHDDPKNVRVYFTGPEGSGLNSFPSDPGEIYCLIAVGSYYQSGASNIPPPGTYSVTDGDTTLTLTFPDQSDVKSNVIIPVPSVSVTEEGILQKINWEWRLGNSDGSGIDPVNLIESYSLGIDAEGPSCRNFPQENRVYEVYDLDLNAFEHELDCNIIEWENVQIIRMGYEDIYGKQILIDFVK